MQGLLCRSTASAGFNSVVTIQIQKEPIDLLSAHGLKYTLKHIYAIVQKNLDDDSRWYVYLHVEQCG